MAEALDKSAPSLAWTLLFTGLGYALPISLFPVSYAILPAFGKGILNLYCLVAWMGLSHFVYAFRGQFLAASRPVFPKYQFLFWLLIGAIALIILRNVLGWMVFSFVMWIYFIPHFIHALIHFNQTNQATTFRTHAISYWFPTLAFAVFTFSLFGLPYLPLSWQPWFLVLIVISCILLGWVGGIFKQLSDPKLSSITLIAFVLLGETLVWGAYSPFMHPQFRQGVYIMHIALASFFHYFRSYAFAREKAASSHWLSFLSIVSINLFIIILGYAVLHQPQLNPLLVLFSVSWFTFWVGLHQYASDIFNVLRKK